MRYSFSKRTNILPLPNLSNIQLESYDWLLTEGIIEILEELGRIEDNSGRGWVLTLDKSKVDKPNLSLEEAIRTGRTYDAPWYLQATLTDPITKRVTTITKTEEKETNPFRKKLKNPDLIILLM